LPLGDGAGHARVRTEPPRLSPRLRRGTGHAPLGDQPERFAIEEEEVPDRRGAEPQRAVEDGVEDRVDGRWRTRDDAQDLARRALLRLGFRKLVVPRLQDFARGRLLLDGRYPPVTR
jgi:hypothetical protein